MRALDISSQNIDTPAQILALHEALQRNPEITSLNLAGNNITGPNALEDLRGLLLQNPQITSLDLSHTGLPRGQLLSLVSEFRYLHHVGIDGELPVIAEELGLNRASNINPPAAAAEAGQVSPVVVGPHTQRAAEARAVDGKGSAAANRQ